MMNGQSTYSELVFHSLLGQLCVTVPVGGDQLRDWVMNSLCAQAEWIPPERVAGMLLGRVALMGEEGWTPELSHIQSGVPGVRVSAHSATEYLVSGIPGGHSGWVEPIRLPSPPQMRSTLAVPGKAVSSVPTHVVVFQSMLGEMVFSVPSGMPDIRQTILSHVTRALTQKRPTLVAGSLLRSFAQIPSADRTLSVDLSPSELTEDTVWLRHLSGATYVYAEGRAPRSDQWEVVGERFLDSRFERQLLGQ